MKRYTLLIITALMMFSANTTKAQMLAVNTDVAMDAILAPSLGVEWVMGKKSSLNLNAIYGRNILGKGIKVAALQPEWRVYISGRPMYHHYFGAIGLLTTYTMEFDHKMHDGDAFGLGASYGYVLPVSSHFLIDFHASVGGVFYRQKEYPTTDNYDGHYTNSEGYPITNAKGQIFMPLRLGVSVTYVIK